MSLGLSRVARAGRVVLLSAYALFLRRVFGFETVVRFASGVDGDTLVSLLRQFGASVGQHCDLEAGLVIHNASESFANLVVEDDCHIGKGVFLDLRAPITLFHNSTVSMRVTIITHTDTGTADIGPRSEPSKAPVKIGPNTYIGAGAIILQGCRIGEGGVVGAGAVVVGDVPCGETVAGVPARTICRHNGH